MVHLKRYFASLAVVLTGLTAYALGVAPWLEPPPVVRYASSVGLPNVNPTDPTAELLERLFSPESWERDNPKIVETEACTLLVKDYKPTPDGKLELTPCTLIFYAAVAKGGAEGEAADGSKQRRPIVMQAPQGAVIQFDRALNFTKAEFGKLVGGELPGEIKIFSPETSPGAGDDLELSTRDIRIGKDRVYTTSQVDFRYGESRGRGRDLTIALLPKDPEDPNSGVGGVRSITLEKIDLLHIETGGSDLFASSGKTRTPSAERQAAAPLEVTCQGPFVFDVLAQTAILDQGVEVLRLNPTGPPDKLTCRRLLLMFADQQPSGSAGALPSRESGVGSRESGVDPLAGRLKRIVAQGSPVELVAPSSATVASAAEIEYSLVSRRLLLVPGTGAEQVSLRQAQNEFTARQLEYEAAEPGRLGRLWAAGPGQLKFTQSAGPAKQTIVARWEKELRIRPHERNQVISLVEKASVNVDTLGQFSADELHLWVLEVGDRETGVGNREGEAPTEPRVQESGDRRQQTLSILPDRILASGHVELESPRVHVDTARLEVWFQNLPPSPQPLPPVGAQAIAPAAHLQAVGVSPARPHGQPLRAPSLAKFDLTGDLVQMQIVRQGEAMDLEDLMIRGHVALDETRTAEPGQRPIRIRGDLLELRGGVLGPGKIDVVGQPAEIGGRGLSLAGSEIHMLRSENRLWIDGPGEASLPAALQGSGFGVQGSGTGGREGEAVAPEERAEPRIGSREPRDTPSEVHVVWQDRFHFDGQTAEMHGEVQARTGAQVVSAGRLEASLNRRIDFASPERRDDTDLALLRFDGGVYVVSRTLDKHGEQLSYDQMQVKNFVMDRTAGTLHADGPGWVSSNRLASAGLPGAVPMPMLPLDPAAQPKMNYLRIEFQGQIAGLIDKRQIEFQRQVRTTFVPVDDWNQQVIVTRLEDLGEQGVLMTSDRLTVIEMNPPGQRPWIEAFATGNNVVEGMSFTVHAPKISYTSDKQLLTLEGDGRADAQLWYRAGPGQKESTAGARKWRYWMETGEFDVEGIGNADFQLLNSGKFRLPGQR